MNSTFESLYKKLNSEQKEAVDTIEGPVMVIAGPGTGKTSILTLRIANILKKTDTSADNILALTFTESGVQSMRRKVVDIVGSVGYRIPIYTFHGFCNDIIKSYPQEFPRIIGAQHVTDLDQLSIFEDLISNTKLKNLKPYGNPLYYIKSILSYIKELKREDIEPKEFKSLVLAHEKELSNRSDAYHTSGQYKGELKSQFKPLQRRIENSKELAVLYDKYQKELQKRRLYDYEDMVMEVLRELRENKNLLLELQEQYQYVLADEHQDANRGQNKLLELISGYHQNPNLFVVGDEKQAIFRFQGASLENFLYFKKRYPKAKLVALKQNYRSTQVILDASHSLIEKNSVGLPELRHKLESSSKNEPVPISIYEIENPQKEAYFIADSVYKRIKEGTKPEEIAILFRDNKDANLVSESLLKMKVPAVVYTDTDIISNQDISKLLSIIKAIHNFGNSEHIAKILFSDIFGLDHLDVYRIIDYSRNNKIPILKVLSSRKELEKSGVENIEVFTSLYKTLHELSVTAKNKGLLEAFQDIVSKTKFIEYALSKPNSAQTLNLYDSLLAHIIELVERQKNAEIADYVKELITMEQHDIPLKSRSFVSQAGAVNLLTAHRAKGLEFDYVYCLGLNDGHWGNRRTSSFFVPLVLSKTQDQDEIEDERRLLYVALTRGRKGVVLTYTEKNVQGKELFPSQFIEEINEKHIKKFKNTLVELPQDNGEKLNAFSVDIKSRDYLRGIFLERGLSVSALNNYLSCPWQFFFLNLVRIPKAQERFQLYGTAIHETLKAFFDLYKNGKVLSKKDLLKLFESFLNRKSISEHDFELFLEKGKKSLEGYYNNYKSKWSDFVINEFNIAGVFVPVKLSDGKNENILIRGVLDKLEFLPDGSINVVDYKTGNPKSRREIEGETSNSEGNYKRQLVFYKLLLDGYENGKYKMVSGEIDFIEPDKNGRYRKEKFTITDQDVLKLNEEIQTAAKEILEFTFWNKECEKKDCEYCRLSKYARNPNL